MVTRDGYDGHNDGSSARLGNAASTGNGLAWNECTFFFVSLSLSQISVSPAQWVCTESWSFLSTLVLLPGKSRSLILG